MPYGCRSLFEMMLPCVAVCCSALLFVAVCLQMPHLHMFGSAITVAGVVVYGSVLQCAAVCCNVLQGVAVCCSVLQCIAECCSVLWTPYLCITISTNACLREKTNAAASITTRNTPQNSENIRKYIYTYLYIYMY